MLPTSDTEISHAIHLKENYKNLDFFRILRKMHILENFPFEKLWRVFNSRNVSFPIFSLNPQSNLFAS
jgi:hypothetical protein